MVYDFVNSKSYISHDYLWAVRQVSANREDEEGVTEIKNAEIILLQPEHSRERLNEKFPFDQMDEMQLRALLVEQSQEHKQLDVRLDELQQNPEHDMLEIARIKKQKLYAKDKIQAIKANLLPDIIA